MRKPYASEQVTAVSNRSSILMETLRKIWSGFRIFHRGWGGLSIYLSSPTSQWLKVILRVWALSHFQIAPAGSPEAPRVLKKALGQWRETAKHRMLSIYQKHLLLSIFREGWRDKVWVSTNWLLRWWCGGKGICIFKPHLPSMMFLPWSISANLTVELLYPCSICPW